MLSTFPTGTATLPCLVTFLTNFVRNLTRTEAEAITAGEGETFTMGHTIWQQRLMAAMTAALPQAPVGGCVCFVRFVWLACRM